MAVQIRELKRRYKMNLALGRVLPTHDLATPLPLSTGNPLFDGALTDKLVATNTLNEPEHLNRAWQMVRNSSREERETLARYGRDVLNDYKLLLAIRAWQDGDEALTMQLLRKLPWGWRLSFPATVIKPASHLFTGWRRSVEFRLIDDPRFAPLRQLFRQLLADANGVTILKYRRRIKESAALLKFRFEGEREQAIHDLCFNKGRKLATADLDASLEPIGTYLRARKAILADDRSAFLKVLDSSDHELPITSYMGMLGASGIRLDEKQPSDDAFRDYAIHCATAVECLLRLKEWGPWLDEKRVEALASKVKHSIIDRGIDVPFFKVTKAFLAAPEKVRKLVLEPLYIPMLRYFGTRVAGRLAEPGPVTFMQPGNVIHIMSFLLYTVLSSAMSTRLFLLYNDGVEEVPPLDLEEVARHLADDRWQFQEWLLKEFGGLTSRYRYTYDFEAIGKTIRQLDPKAPLLLDLPFAGNMEILSALLPFERVFNLNAPYGAPGEICIAYEYYAQFLMSTRTYRYGIWERFSDMAAQRFAEFLDKLDSFSQLAEVAP